MNQEISDNLSKRQCIFMVVFLFAVPTNHLRNKVLKTYIKYLNT